MVYANQERRRQADKARYWRQKGLPVPNGNSGSSQSVSPVPEFVLRGNKIPEFQPAGSQRQLARAENWFSDHKVTITSVLIPLVAGVGIGVGLDLFTRKYQNEVFDRLKQLASRQNQQEQPFLSETEKSNRSLNAILDVGQAYLDRTAASL